MLSLGFIIFRDEAKVMNPAQYDDVQEFVSALAVTNRKGEIMSKAEVLHELYNLCKEINFNDSHEIISGAESEEEADFFRTVTDFILQQKQKKVIAEKRF